MPLSPLLLFLFIFPTGAQQASSSQKLSQIDASDFSQREQEVLAIAQSVNELAVMFKQLNSLIIEQGTILDRIDYNLEQTTVHVSKGKVELVKANEISKKSYAMKLIVLLAVLLFILIIVYIIKRS